MAYMAESSVQALHDAAVAALTPARDRCQEADRKSLEKFSRILMNAGSTRFWSTLMEVTSSPHVETKHNGITYSTAPFDVDHFRSFMIEHRKRSSSSTTSTRLCRDSSIACG